MSSFLYGNYMTVASMLDFVDANSRMNLGRHQATSEAQDPRVLYP